jgi:hypothetical protein
MEEQIQVTITGVSATADELIAHLSRNLEDHEIEFWENPDNYVLKRTHALGIEEEINDEAISYDDEIPGVVFPVKTRNVERDVLKLTYTSPDGEYEYSTVFETEPTPEPGDTEWIEEKLTTIDEVVHDIQTRVAPLEDATRQLTEAIPGITDLLHQILERIDTNPEEIREIKDRLALTEGDILKLRDAEIPRIDGLILKLEGSRPADSSVLQALEDQLKESKADLSASPAQGEALVDEVFNHWQENLTAFEGAMRNPDIQPKVKAKIQELRSYIGWKISEISVLRAPIANNPVVRARVGRLKSITITNLNEVLGSIGYLKRSMV